MYISLLFIGVVLAAAGLVTIGFGIPINAFSLGNTLIMAGTTAVTGGFVLIGLAAAVRQLTRIADILRSGARAPRMSETGDAAVPPTARLTPAPQRPPARAPEPVPMPDPVPMPRAPEPPMARPPEPAMPRPPEPRLSPEPRFSPGPRLAPEPRSAEARQIEPRFPVGAPAASPAAEKPGPLDWLRAKGKSASAPAGDPPVVEVSDDEAPLSPRPPLRPPFSSMTQAADPPEPKAWSPEPGDLPAPLRPEPRSERSRATPVAETAKDFGFDTVWPDSRARHASSDPSDTKTESRIEPRMEPRAEAKPQREEREHERADDRPAPERKDDKTLPLGTDRGPAILKSGVIDGMAYTLYADGSIEAELPQGTVKFASVDALRAHLENNGG